MKKSKNKKPIVHKNTTHIGIDLMGSDSSPIVFIEAAIDFIKEHPDDTLFFVLFGTEDIEKKFLHMQKHSPVKNLIFHKTKTSIFMHENPLFALRRKKNSSMIEGMRLLKTGEIDAFVSAGNTGALMGSAKMVLPMLAEVDRPALLALMPTKTHPLVVLDVGANLSPKPELLVQFAMLGIAFQKFRGTKRPTLGLLNIGSEEKKGTVVHQKTYWHLQKIQDKIPDEFLFLGNIEGKQVFEGELDVLITDGFTGNVFLKTIEGIGSFILDLLQTNSTEAQYSFLQTLILDLHKNIHYAEYPGAVLIGVDGIVIKCHGYSSKLAIQTALKGAIELVKLGFLDHVKKSLEGLKGSFR